MATLMKHAGSSNRISDLAEIELRSVATDDVLGSQMDVFKHRIDDALLKVNQLEEKVQQIEHYYSDNSKRSLNNSKASSISKDKDKVRNTSSLKNQQEDATNTVGCPSKRMLELLRQFNTILRQLPLRLKSSTRNDLLLPLRLLRNLCAGEATNQDMFIDHDGVEIVSTSINRFGYHLDHSDCAIVRTGLQVLANVSLAGKRHQQAIWKHLFPSEFVKIARIRKRETCDPLAMIIYVCCDGSHELFSDLGKEQGLTIMAELISTATTVGFGEDWLKLLLSRICIEESHLPDLFIATRQVTSESGDACFTSEQAFLLQITSEILNERIGEIRIRDPMSLYVLTIFKKALGIIDFSTPCRSSLPTGSAVIDVLGYSLAILRDACAQDELSSEDVVVLLVSEGMLDLLLNVLQELEPPSQIRKMIKQVENDDAATSADLKKVCPYKGFRRDVVSVIGNCAHRKKFVQDEVRNKDGVLLLLQQCVHDDDNPFLREWGLWTAWNLLGNNEENSELVADLEYQESVDVPELLKAGLRVELDPRTRKPKLVNISE